LGPQDWNFRSTGFKNLIFDREKKPANRDSQRVQLNIQFNMSKALSLDQEEHINEIFKPQSTLNMEIMIKKELSKNNIEINQANLQPLDFHYDIAELAKLYQGETKLFLRRTFLVT